MMQTKPTSRKFYVEIASMVNIEGINVPGTARFGPVENKAVANRLRKKLLGVPGTMATTVITEEVY